VDVAVGGRGVGLAGRRVGVDVGGRRVAVGGTRVHVGVAVAARVGVSLGAGKGVGVEVCSGVGVAVSVGIAEGRGVLVGVGVTVGEGAKREISGQVQLMVSAAATAMMRMAILLRRPRAGLHCGVWLSPESFTGCL
jgi:hypothetical protein